jgi:hypothetical protein
MFLGMGVKKTFLGNTKQTISNALSDYFGRARLLPIARHL